MSVLVEEIHSNLGHLKMFQTQSFSTAPRRELCKNFAPWQLAVRLFIFEFEEMSAYIKN